MFRCDPGSYSFAFLSTVNYQPSTFFATINFVLKTIAFLLTFTAATTIFAAGERSAKDVVAQLYKVQDDKKQDPFVNTKLLGRYFDAELLKLYLRDVREAKGEVGRLEVDPLYYAQDTEITEFSISEPEKVGGETHVVVRFKNMKKPKRIEFVMSKTADGWRIGDIRYDDGNSLKKILEAPL